MKVSLLKISRKKEVIKRVELREIAKMIRENPEVNVHFSAESLETPINRVFPDSIKNSKSLILTLYSPI